jgi:solute carrier family 25 oxoglutarate transporter 11
MAQQAATASKPAPAPAQQSRAGKFVMGGLSGMIATCFVQPMDLIKNRMQLSGEGGGKKVHKTAFHAVANIARQEGVYGLYNGLSAGLLRQASYTTTRLGVYQWLEDSVGPNPNVFKKLLMGMTAGGVGAVVGNPAEVVLVRMTADGRLPPAERRNYSNAFTALFRIMREEGVATLWRGTTPTVARAMVLNAAQLGGYSQAKQGLLSSGYFKDDIKLHFAASLISGFLSTAVSIPIDISKTRLQTMKVNEKGEFPYKGTTDVLMKVVRNEGFLSLWKGFTPYFLRLGPHTIITFVALEQMKKNWSF